MEKLGQMKKKIEEIRKKELERRNWGRKERRGDFCLLFMLCLRCHRKDCSRQLWICGHDRGGTGSTEKLTTNYIALSFHLA